jgi:hypothetical protein
MLIPVRTGVAVVTETKPARRRLGARPETWLLAGLTILGGVLRFATITGQSYWVDEAQAAHELQLSFGAMLGAWSHVEGNPPLYFVVGWGWARLFGTGEAGLRSLSALAGTAVIPITYLCGRELVSRRAGLVAAALAAVSPFMIWYSQEAREYMLLAALSGASLLFFARAFRRRTRRDLVLWTVFSGLALLTAYFAAFLIAAEAIALLYRAGTRLRLAAVGSLAALEAVLIPHALSNLTNQLQWVVAVPLSVRVQQVPVAFAMNTLYQSSIVSYGLLGAALLAAILIAVLVIGADATELRGAGIAAALAASVVLTPLLLALLGHDDYIVRGLIPAWIPLAIVIGAACTTAHARAAGAALAVAMLAMFVYAGIRIDGNPEYQRPNWRGVADALGHPRGTRAIVAYDGEFATGPLSLYLAGAPWPGSAQGPSDARPLSVGEVDIVGSTSDTLSKLPSGTTLIGARAVDGYQVDRFSLSRSSSFSSATVEAWATKLLGPAPPDPSVLIQRPSAYASRP